MWMKMYGSHGQQGLQTREDQLPCKWIARFRMGWDVNRVRDAFSGSSLLKALRGWQRGSCLSLVTRVSFWGLLNREVNWKNISGWMFVRSNTWDCSGWCGSVDWGQAWEQKGCWFDSRSGHMPGLQARSPVGGVREATTHWCFSPSPPCFPPL